MDGTTGEESATVVNAVFATGSEEVGVEIGDAGSTTSAGKEPQGGGELHFGS